MPASTAPDHKVALVTIGQSPRPAQAAEIARHLPEGVEILHRGALDDLSDAEIAAAAPKDGADTLFTLLRGGVPAQVSKAVVHAGVNRRLAELDAEGVQVSLLLCTGTFPGLTGQGLVLMPSAALDAVVGAVFTKGRMGVLVPLAAQVPELPKKWQAPGVEVFATDVQPGAGPEAMDAAAARLVAQKPDIIVMDCMGYTAADKARVRTQFDGPVVLGITAAARIMGEVIG